MKKIITLVLFAAILIGIGYSQEKKCRDINEPGPTISEITRVLVGDFTITDTDGNSLNLYNTLATGKIVMFDLFFVG